jgi:aspartyl-tRNA(Asn)/glutamyl-tRNA(Gln) amidotransferase subunit B
MTVKYQPVVGLEVHAVLETRSKMFCDCPVVDSTHDQANVAVCPVCAGMPGMLPVLNKAAVDYALRVALALNCRINVTSIFARKSYFYPDLPKGFQISQYEEPLAEDGWLTIATDEGEQRVGIRRVHLEEDTGKLTHIQNNDESHSLVDLNRSGVPLLEIVTEPELHSVQAVRAYAYSLRSILRYLEVNSGDMEKGLMRIEPNISIRPSGSKEFGTRAEIKNLNSFRSLERALNFELERQTKLVESGKPVKQQTLGWDDISGKTLPQRSKEVAEDYRYFPEPDLPPLHVDAAWVEQVRATIPELPDQKMARFIREDALSAYDANILVAERDIADFYEEVKSSSKKADAILIAHWITGPLFSHLNEKAVSIQAFALQPIAFAQLLDILANEEINPAAGRKVLAEMIASGKSAEIVVSDLGLKALSDIGQLTDLIKKTIEENPQQVDEYLQGKEGIINWLFGQAMAASQGRANPQSLRDLLKERLEVLRAQQENK